jgi:hypothetical protein
LSRNPKDIQRIRKYPRADDQPLVINPHNYSF